MDDNIVRLISSSKVLTMLSDINPNTKQTVQLFH